ncbi:MAG: hypothetical protein ACLQGP_22320 [Isosphaeraceae bacterium]
MPRIQSTIVPTAPPSRLMPAAEPPVNALPLHLELARQLDGLPKDLGITLLVLGMFGVAIPGPVPPGFSFILLGVIALQPCLIERFGGPMARRFPRVFRVLVGLVTRFRSDLASRYPGTVPPDIATRSPRCKR